MLAPAAVEKPKKKKKKKKKRTTPSYLLPDVSQLGAWKASAIEAESKREKTTALSYSVTAAALPSLMAGIEARARDKAKETTKETVKRMNNIAKKIAEDAKAKEQNTAVGATKSFQGGPQSSYQMKKMMNDRAGKKDRASRMAERSKDKSLKVALEAEVEVMRKHAEKLAMEKDRAKYLKNSQSDTRMDEAAAHRKKINSMAALPSQRHHKIDKQKATKKEKKKGAKGNKDSSQSEPPLTQASPARRRSSAAQLAKAVSGTNRGDADSSDEDENEGEDQGDASAVGDEESEEKTKIKKLWDPSTVNTRQIPYACNKYMLRASIREQQQGKYCDGRLLVPNHRQFTDGSYDPFESFVMITDEGE